MRKSKETFERKDLSYLGTNGERAFLKSVVENHKLFLEIEPFLKDTLFADTASKEIIKIIKSQYTEKGQFSSWRDIEYQLKDRAKTEEEMIMFRDCLQECRDTIEGQQVATESAVNTIKMVEMLQALDKGKAAIEKGYSTEKSNDIIDSIKRIGSRDEGMITNPWALMGTAFAHKKSEKVPTGIQELDEKMNGGLTKGTVGMLIAGTGWGKTTLASILCCNAGLERKNVLFVFFEDTVNEILYKIYAHLTGRYTNYYEDVPEESKKDYAREIINSHPTAKEAIKERIRLAALRNGCTIDVVFNKILSQIANGWKPDMVFIDYLSCIQASENKNLAVTNEHQLFERMMKKIEAFAKENDIAIWVAQQTNRDAFKKETSANRMGNVQGSFRATQPASAVLYLDRLGLPIGESLANLYLDKCRGGELGEWEQIYLNNGNCQIDLSGAIKNNKKLEWEDEEQ